MNTKTIPAIISLTAGLVAVIVTMIRKAELIEILTTLFIVLLSFYILGCIIKAVLDRFVKEDEENEKDEEEEELENIETEDSTD